MTGRPPSAVCFDLDETLLDGSGLGPSIARACEEIALKAQHLTAAELLAANLDCWEEYWAEVEADWAIGVVDGASLNYEIWRRTLEACGSTDGSLVAFAREVHTGLARAAHRLFDDAPVAVEAARRRGVRLALVTNGAADTQREKVDALGIGAWFDTVVISGEIGRAKPDVGPFQTALDRLGMEPSDVWHVGDSLPADIGGANAAGLISTWLNRTGRIRTATDPIPDHEIRSLLELPGLLDIGQDLDG